jgi:hypothetical protein
MVSSLAALSGTRGLAHVHARAMCCRTADLVASGCPGFRNAAGTPLIDPLGAFSARASVVVRNESAADLSRKVNPVPLATYIQRLRHRRI